MNTFVYCPRRFYYELVEKEMVINEHIEEGKLKHTRPDEEMRSRKEKDRIVSRRVIQRYVSL